MANIAEVGTALYPFLVIFAAICAGIAWNTIGIWQKYKEEGVKSIDWLKVRKNVIIGVVLGVIAYTISLSEAVNIPAIVGINTFLGAVLAFFPFVVIAERVFTRKKNEDNDPIII